MAVKRIKPEARIKVLAKENPRRAGTRGAKLFALYRRARTVGAFLKAGKSLKGPKGKAAPARMKDLRWDMARKHIAVSA